MPRHPRKRWEGERFVTAPLSAHAVLNGKTPCRVCGRELRVGDVVMARTWRVGHSCVTCGWTTLDDLRFEPAWERALAKQAMSDHDARRLVDLGLVVLDDKTHHMAWTTTGARLRDQALASRATADGGVDNQKVETTSHPTSAAASGAGAGGRS